VEDFKTLFWSQNFHGHGNELLRSIYKIMAPALIKVSPALLSTFRYHVTGKQQFNSQFVLLIRYLNLSKQAVFSVFHHAFFNSIIDKHQHMHFTFNNILV